MRTSVIIPCRDAARTVADAIGSALGQSESPLEVLVVDDASSDASAAVARKAGARVLVNPTRRNAGGARNAGIEATSGELLAFLDADAVPPRDWLARAREIFAADPSIAGVGGSIVNGRAGRYGELDYFLNHSEWIGGRAGEKHSIPTMAIVYRRDAVGPARFPESNSGEDTAFALAVASRGGRLWYEPAIRVTHRHERLDFHSFWEKQVACGKTIFWTRSTLDRPGRILVRAPILLLLLPHLWITLGRMIRAGYAGRALALFPWLAAGEVARIRGFLQARRERRSAKSAETVQAAETAHEEARA
jgi:glycosyltransferase involved in cell wall biosynthesis